MTRLLAVCFLVSVAAFAVAARVLLAGAAWAYLDDEEQAELEAEAAKLRFGMEVLADPVQRAKVALQVAACERHARRLAGCRKERSE